MKRVIDTCEEAGVKYEFKQLKSGFVAILYRTETTEKTTEKILSLIKLRPNITAKELAESLGITTDGVDYHIRRLKKSGVISRIGGDKGGSWKINE